MSGGGGEIGGYFGLELPPPTQAVMPEALRFQSARAAFAALLAALAPRRVWMPRYICDSMLSPLERARVPIAFYGLDPSLRVGPEPVLEAGDLLLYVNYFGVCGEGERDALARFGADRVILDRSQAFFAPARECLAAIYSPRKFFGLPDGGLLATRAAVAPPARRDQGSVARSAHLLMRHDGPAREGYESFRQAEATLDDVTPRGMSRLTARILDSVDLEAVRRRREANFAFWHRRLGARNRLAFDDGQIPGPLCYPFLGSDGNLRDIMTANDVFLPTYWPEVSSRAGAAGVEDDMVRRCLPLPCDQRYAPGDLAKPLGLLEGASRGRAETPNPSIERSKR